LKNKKLDKPKINSNTELLSTSEELNKLHNNNITPNDLTALHTYAEKLPALSDLSTSKTVQAQIENIKDMVEASNYFLYHKTFKATSSTKEFDYETILNELNIDTNIYYIVPGSIMVQLYYVDKLSHNYVMHSLGEGQTHSCLYYEDEDILHNKYYFKKIFIANFISGEWYNIKIFFKLGLL
jgi:hypothetical protein